MIFIVLIPAWLWAFTIITIWLVLMYQSFFIIGVQHYLMRGLLLVLGLQSITAIFAAIISSHNPIALPACLIGLIGSISFPVIIFAELVALAFLYRVWPKYSKGKVYSFFIWLVMWAVFNMIVFFSFFRSASLCTV